MRTPLDTNGNPVTHIHEFTATGTLAFAPGAPVRGPLPTSTGDNPRVVRLVATEPVYVAFGGDTIETDTDGLLLAPLCPLYARLTGESHVSALPVSEAGALNMAEVG
jgi:hypothetical protein